MNMALVNTEMNRSLINTEIKPFKATAYHNGKFVEVSEASLKGKWSVVFFYPADFTFVCPTELGDLADNYAEFKKLGAEIYAVSTDTHFTHKAWHDTSETIGKVQFPMVGDPTGTITRNFGVHDRGSGPGRARHLRHRPRGHDQDHRDPRRRHRPQREELLRKVKAAQYVAAHPGEVCPAKWKEGEDARTVAGPRRQDLMRCRQHRRPGAPQGRASRPQRCTRLRRLLSLQFSKETHHARRQHQDPAQGLPRAPAAADRARRLARRQRKAAEMRELLIEIAACRR